MSPPPASNSDPELHEERYCLRDMLVDVAQERQTGAFGQEKLRRADIRKVITAKPKKRRAAEN